MHDEDDDYCLIFDVAALVDQNNVHKFFLIFKCKSETGRDMRRIRILIKSFNFLPNLFHFERSSLFPDVIIDI
jgi:hypothetical protein